MWIRSLIGFLFLASTLCSCSSIFRGMRDLERYENEGWYIQPVKQGKTRPVRELVRAYWDKESNIIEESAGSK